MARNARTAVLTERHGHADGDARTCDWPGCTEGGDFKAPKSREALNQYHWFCLLHIRAYNKSWNYYAGMSDAEVEADRRRDTVWNRPTWPLSRDGDGDPQFGADGPGFDDPFGFFSEGGEARRGNGKGGARHTDDNGQAAQGSHRAALVAFGLRHPVTADDVKARYKVLVKLHHPDANGGAKAAEEKLKEINEAYRTLMQFLMP